MEEHDGDESKVIIFALLALGMGLVAGIAWIMYLINNP